MVQLYDPALYTPAPVSASLIPPLSSLPPALASLLKHPRRRLSIHNFKCRHLSLLPHLSIPECTPLPPVDLPATLPPRRVAADKPSDAVSYHIRATLDSIATDAQRKNTRHPLALHLGPHKINLECTVHPLLACVHEDGSHHHKPKEIPGRPPGRGGYQELPLVVAYCVAMAQRWFTKVAEDEVRVWVLATRKDQTAQVYWANMRREHVVELRVEVRRAERLCGLGEDMGAREMLARCVVAVWEEVWSRSGVAENKERWPKLMKRVKRGEGRAEKKGKMEGEGRKASRERKRDGETEKREALRRQLSGRPVMKKRRTRSQRTVKTQA